jgi:sialic acid synthase SpsE
MLRRLELSDETFADLARYAMELGIEFLSSPFDEESVDLLERIGIKAYKVPSGELTNAPLLEHIAATGKPVILSTGMAEADEIRLAVDLLRKTGSGGIILLHCVSIYPAPLGHMNLRSIPVMAAAFDLPVGISDHSEGFLAAVIARALGACVVEKHFTIDRSLSGPDHRSSLEPADLIDLINKVRLVDEALGNGTRVISMEESEIRDVARKSLVARCTIPEGSIVSGDMIAVKRPGTGISPFELGSIIGRRARITIRKNELIRWDMLQ